MSKIPMNDLLAPAIVTAVLAILAVGSILLPWLIISKNQPETLKYEAMKQGSDLPPNKEVFLGVLERDVLLVKSNEAGYVFLTKKSMSKDFFREVKDWRLEGDRAIVEIGRIWPIIILIIAFMMITVIGIWIWILPHALEEIRRVLAKARKDSTQSSRA